MATPLQQIIHDGGPGGAGWEDSWRQSVTPWDAGVPAPSLVRLVQEGALPRGRALVPGVGGGYDALALVDAERTVVGLDLAPTAVAAATTRRDQAGVSAQQCAFVAGDFFTHDLGAPFQLVWDYTFLCALPPELRPRWAARMRELLAPDGLLVTLIFPVSDHTGGPPYAVSPQLYEQARLAAVYRSCRAHAARADALAAPQLLGDAGFEAVELAPVPDELSHAARRGKEWLGKWRRRPDAAAPKM
jgi:hypothetical protein